MRKKDVEESALSKPMKHYREKEYRNEAAKEILSEIIGELKYPLLVGVLLILFIFTSTANASTCGAISTNTVLDSDVSSPNTCFTIRANSITLDCNGHIIQHTGQETATTGNWGINLTTFDRVKLKNCDIRNFTIGIYVYGRADNTTIDNSTISSYNRTGIQVTSAWRTNITNVTLFQFGRGGYGIYATTRNVDGLRLENVSATSVYGYPFYAQYINNLTVLNSTFIVQVQGGATVYPVRIQASNFSIITNVTAITNGSGYAFYLDNSKNNTIANSTCNARITYCIYDINSRNNTYTNLTIPAYNGIYISGGLDIFLNNLWIKGNLSSGTNIYLLNSFRIKMNGTRSETIGTTSVPIYLSNTQDSTFYNLTAISPANNRRALYLFRSSNNSFFNSTFGIIPFQGVVYDNCNANNNNLINTSFNRSAMAWNITTCPVPAPTNSIYVKWYMNFTVGTTNQSANNASEVSITQNITGYMTPPFGVLIFNGTTDQYGNLNNLTEVTEFYATGVFKYNKSAQINYTIWANSTIQAVKNDFIVNATIEYLNRSFSPYMLNLTPIYPRIINIGLNKIYPYVVDATNTTYPIANVSDMTTCPCWVNFTIMFENATGIYYYYINMPNVSTDFFTYIGRNYSMPHAGNITINVTASSIKDTVNKSFRYEVNTEIPITTCGYQMLPYKQYKISGAGILCTGQDGVFGANGAQLRVQATATGNPFLGYNPRGITLQGVTNFTLIFEGTGNMRAWGIPIFINNSNNISILSLVTGSGRINHSVFINGSTGINLFGGSLTQTAPNVAPLIFIAYSKNVSIANITGTPAANSFLKVHNSTSTSVSGITYAALGIAQPIFDFADSNYTRLWDLLLTSGGLPLSNALLLLERSNYSKINSTVLLTGVVGLNMTDSSHLISSRGTGNAASGFSLAGIWIYARSGATAINNTLDSFAVDASKDALHLEGIDAWSVRDTHVIGGSYTASWLYLPSFSLFTANSTGIVLSNSSLLYTDLPGLGHSEIREGTLQTMNGNQFIRLEDTQNTKNFSMGRSPNMTYWEGYNLYGAVVSSTFNVSVYSRITNSSVDIVYENANTTLNVTDYFGVIGSGIGNSTCLPTYCVNETKHRFYASYAGATNSSTFDISSNLVLPSLWLTADPSIMCADVSTDVTLTQNVTINLPVCWKITKAIVFDCAGFSVIANFSTVAFNITETIPGSGATIKGCNFNSTATGEFAPVVNIHKNAIDYLFYFNNTGQFYGTLGSLDGSNHRLANSTHTIFIPASKSAISAYQSASGLTLENMTLTGYSTAGGNIIDLQPVLFPIGLILTITNSTINAQTGIDKVISAISSGAISIDANSHIILGNTGADNSLRFQVGLLSGITSNISANADRSMAILSGTPATFTNVTSNLQNIILEGGAQITNDYTTWVHMIYNNGSNCSLCLVEITDAQDNPSSLYIADTNGDVGPLILREYGGDGGTEDASYFQVNGVDQANGTAYFTFFTPHKYAGTGTNTSWTGSNITYSDHPMTVWVVVSPPPDYYPSISLIAPPNGTTTLETNITFVYLASDDTALMNTSLWTNITGVWNFTAVNSSEISFYNLSSFTLTNLSNGTILWNVQACDNAGQCAFAPNNFTLTIGPAGSTVIDDAYLLAFPIGLSIGALYAWQRRRGKTAAQPAAHMPS